MNTNDLYKLFQEFAQQIPHKHIVSSNENGDANGNGVCKFCLVPVINSELCEHDYEYSYCYFNNISKEPHWSGFYKCVICHSTKHEYLCERDDNPYDYI